MGRDKRVRVCSECNIGRRNSKFGGLCTACGKLATATSNESTIREPGTVMARRQMPSRAAAAAQRAVDQGGILKLPRGTFPVEFMKKLDFLRADGSLSDTPLPDRFQIVLDFTILDLKAWNAVMDRFHLQDICSQILQEKQKGEMNSMELQLERLAEYAKALYQSVKLSEV